MIDAEKALDGVPVNVCIFELGLEQSGEPIKFAHPAKPSRLSCLQAPAQVQLDDSVSSRCENLTL